MPGIWDQFQPYTGDMSGQLGQMGQSVPGVGGSDEIFPGVDSNLRGEDYLKQFPQEIQQGARDFIAGRVMPTGNPRKTNVVRMVAGKYGSDIGVPADDTAFTERRNLRSQLTSGAPSSMGGQLRNGTTAMDHLAKVAESAVNLNNSGGWGIAPLAHAINYARGVTTQQSAAMENLKDEAAHYGQEITKFYAGSPGGEAERERFLTSLSGVKSPQELAAVIEAELALIPGKMSQIKEEISTKLGPYVDKEYAQKFAEQDAHSARIQAALDRLHGRTSGGGGGAAAAGPNAGGTPAVSPAAAPSGPQQNISAFPTKRPEGSIAVNPSTGDRMIVRGGAWVPYGR
jgi:hypothetical protein